MTAPSPGKGAEPAPPKDAEELSREIERTREQLGETVEALAAKADIKARVRDKAGQLSSRVKSTSSTAAQQVAAVCGRVKTTGTAAAQRAASAARHRKVPAAAAASAAVVAILVAVRWRRR